VIPWTLLDTATVPGEGGELRLMQRDTEFSIRLGRSELMNSRMHGSEEALATLACARLAAPRPRLLIGGLGMGFTLRAALDALGPEARVIITELVPAVVAWNRGPLAALTGHSLADARVSIREADVGGVIRAEPLAYDAILLDVDNGPEALSRDGNNQLYDRAGLAAAHAALRPGGVLAVWSAGPDAHFRRRLRDTGFAVEEIGVRARGNRGARHVVWIARRDHSGRNVSAAGSRP
jgi:spermidine synthase